MVVYATLQQADDYDPGVSLPADADRWLVIASQLVAEAARFAVYTVDATGAPVDAGPAAAMRDAVCAQVSSWARAGVDPLTPTQNTARVVSSQSLSAVGSVSYDTTAEQAAAATTQRAGYSLGNEAYRILNAAGLLSRRVFV